MSGTKPIAPSSLFEGWQKLAVNNLYIYAFFAIGLDGTILTWNPGVKDVLGYDEADFVGQSAKIIFTEEDRKSGILERELRLAKEQGNANDVRWHQKSDGSKFWATGAMTALSNEKGSLLGFAKVVRDSTSSKKLEESLAQLNSGLEQEVRARTSEISQLAVQLTLAEQQERQRIATHLHDSVQQELYALQFNLAKLRKGLEGEQAETLATTSETLRKVLQLTRDVVTDLGSVALREEDFRVSLQWLADSMLARQGLKVNLNCTGSCKITDEALRILLFNLTREILFNSVKHADVNEASLTLSQDANSLQLMIEDKGKGFKPDFSQEPKGTGLGLYGAQKRIRLFGGNLQIDSAPGQGTRILISLPVKRLASE